MARSAPDAALPADRKVLVDGAIQHLLHSLGPRRLLRALRRFGFLGFWGPSTTLIADVFPTRIRGVANGVVWVIGFFVGFVPWPFATVVLQQATGFFALAFP